MKKMIGSICFATVLTLSFLAASRAVHVDSPWTIKLTPSAQSNVYDGIVEVIAIFQDGKEHAVILPSKKYEPGNETTFNVSFVSPGPLQMVFIRTRGVCPMGLIPLKVLRLRQIVLDSVSTNTTYTKMVKDLAIKDACQSNKSLGSAIRDFDQFNAAFCLVDGKRYANGEHFDLGCVGKCSCNGGMYGCVDMCPPIAWSHERKCHYVHVPGQCCDAVKCEEDTEMNSCNAPMPANAETDKGRQVPVRRYPWAVFLCVDEKCSQVYPGVIVGSRHILIYAPDLSTFPNARIIVGQYIAGANANANATSFSTLHIVNVTAHPDFVNTDSPVADSASRLQLLQVNQLFTFDKEVQAANLPLSQKQCAQMVTESCPLMTVGWDRTDDQDNKVRQWFLHAEKTKLDAKACNNASQSHPRSVDPLPRVRGEKRGCISGLTRHDCTGPLGGAVVASAGTVDFLVGMLDPDASLFPCNAPGTASMLPICKYMTWILSTTTAGNF